MESIIDRLNKATSVIIEKSSSSIFNLTIDSLTLEIEYSDFYNIFNQVNLTKLEIMELKSCNGAHFLFKKNTKCNFSKLKTFKIDNCNLDFSFSLIMPSLENLRIENQSINSNDYFEKLQNLKELKFLIFTSTNLSCIDKSDFSGLIHLIELDLSRNKIKTIEKNSFDRLLSLKLLNLSFNELTIIEENVFDGLISLEKLDLTDNNALNLNESIFKTSIANSLNNLKTLDINYINYIDGPSDYKSIKEKKIDDDTFISLSNLESLNLSKVQITDITENSFNGLSSLKVLDLSGNLLNRIDKNAFSKLERLQELDLQVPNHWDSFQSINFLEQFFEKKNFTLKLDINGETKKIEMDYFNRLDGNDVNIPSDKGILKEPNTLFIQIILNQLN